MVKKVTRVYDDLQDAYTYKVTGIEENKEKSYNVSALYKEFFELSSVWEFLWFSLPELPFSPQIRPGIRKSLRS